MESHCNPEFPQLRGRALFLQIEAEREAGTYVDLPQCPRKEPCMCRGMCQELFPQKDQLSLFDHDQPWGASQ